MNVFDMLLAIAAVITGIVLLVSDFHSKDAFFGGLFIAGGLIYLLTRLRKRRRLM